MEEDSAPRSPRKKLKTEKDSNAQSDSYVTILAPAMLQVDDKIAMSVEQKKESDVGISKFVASSTAGFEGVLKHRYSDFLVNEISPAGVVYHLDDLTIPNIPQKRDVAQNSSQIVTSAPQVPDRSDSDQQALPTPSEEQNGAVEEWQEYAKSKGVVRLEEEQRSSMVSLLGEDVTEQSIALFNKVLNSPHRTQEQYGRVKSISPLTDRQARTRLHQLVRECFRERLDSYTEPDSTFVIQAKPQGRGPRPPRAGEEQSSHNGRWPSGPANAPDRQGHRSPHMNRRDRFVALGGEYLHFSLYKENKDTMEVVSFLSSRLRVQPKLFQFAGTKDRRAVTIQRVSVHRVFPEQVSGLNRQLRQARIGNFKYEMHSLELGALAGNEFVITLRNCIFPGLSSVEDEDAVSRATAVVKEAIQSLAQNGFLNYFGLQRFGTFTTRTDLVGIKLLQGDYEGAVDAILNVDAAIRAHAADPNDTSHSSDDKARALGIDEWRRTGRLSDMHRIPRKFSAELNVIRSLHGPKDRNFLNALQSVPRNLRLMYLHAYQSLIWNLATTHRWAKAGPKLLVGDLVLVREHRGKTDVAVKDEAEVDEDGELIIRPTGDDRAIAKEDRFERARALAQEEIDSGAYTIFDVVLPMPGFDVEYPPHMLSFYKDTMAKPEHGGLDPLNMRRNVKDLSLSGSYRKLLARPGERYDFKVVKYTKDTEQFVKTDADLLDEKRQAQRKDWMQKKASEEPEEGASVPEPEPAATYGLDGAAESKAGTEPPSEIDPTTESAAAQPSSTGASTLPPPLPDDEQTAPAEPAAVQPAAHLMEVEAKPRLAVVLTLQLGSSTYATMALRELTRGGAKPYKPDFGGGR